MSYMRVYYYENELEDEFSSASIKAKKIDADYDYSMDSAGRRFLKRPTRRSLPIHAMSRRLQTNRTYSEINASGMILSV